MFRATLPPLLTALACLLGALLATATAFAADPARGGSASYIVVLKGDVPSSGVVAEDHDRRHGARVRDSFEHALKAYTADLPLGRVDDVRRDRRVAYVEPDTAVAVAGQTLPWGIRRVEADRSSTRAGDGRGAVAGVRAYVLDTGVDTSRRDLNVVGQQNFAGGVDTDCHGHGTHVAGTLAAGDNTRLVVGTAPAAPLVSVKVLDCDGHGSSSDVIRGIDWVTAHARKPAVANMSLLGPANRALDDAVRRSAGSGVLYAVAAGNDGRRACPRPPARAGAGRNNGIVTVAAVGSGYREPAFSNYGGCVDLWAPGVDVLSLRRFGGTTKMSGTSMAAPHVAGGGALRLSSAPRSAPANVEASLKQNASDPGTHSKDGRAISQLSLAGY